MKSTYLLIDKVRALLAWTIELALTNSPANRSQMLYVSGGKLQQSSLFRRYTHCFRCNKFTMPKAKTKGSKKRNGGSNGNLNGESAKETVLSEMRVSG